ncbi:MAG: glutathione binding-like protein [Sutterellaceae bacterium]|nr:glutathione binding-like protein [Sutterellaceae bacterium]MDD7441487.1 glutathione binding-like protein [Sutterellaceae bacterium]MDY2868794.1 glutathione binding-like protein [Mesosutterella sp.]
MMVLYSGTTDPFSHRCRFVLFEKGMDFEIRDVDMFNIPAEVKAMSPYGTVPILNERDLVLYEANVIDEYIDERFPHPQLMPSDPITRARTRMFLYGFERELYAPVRVLEDHAADEKAKAAARKAISNQLQQFSSHLSKNKYFLGEEFSMLDICIAPLLWRLDYYKIELPKTAKAIQIYAERVFSRPAFMESMTPSEKVMRR